MASQPDKTDSQQSEAVSADDRQLVAEMASVHREKIELAGHILEVSQQENQRHYAFLTEQLKVQDEQNKRGYRLAWLIVGGLVVVLCLPLYLLLYMVFYGNEAQVGNAMKILTEVAKALGSAGAIFLIVFLMYSGLKRLINR